MCIQTITFKQNELWLRYLAWWFFLTLLGSCLKIEVIGNSWEKQFWLVVGKCIRSVTTLPCETWHEGDNAVPISVWCDGGMCCTECSSVIGCFCCLCANGIGVTLNEGLLVTLRWVEVQSIAVSGVSVCLVVCLSVSSYWIEVFVSFCTLLTFASWMLSSYLWIYCWVAWLDARSSAASWRRFSVCQYLFFCSFAIRRITWKANKRDSVKFCRG